MPPSPSPSPVPPPEWSARYQQYLTAAAGRAARTRDLYREIVEQVAAGDLSPGALDDRLPAFLQTNGASYANSLAEVSMRFLTGLVRTGTTYSYELVERILPGAGSPPRDTAPEFQPADWADWFGRLTEYATSQSTAVSELLRTVMERVASGDLVPANVHEASTGFSDERLPASVLDTVALYFDLLSGLDKISSEFGSRYLSAVLEAADRRDEFALDLKGPLGQPVSVRLAVANTQADATSVRCVLTDLRRADGVGPAFEPQASLEPERFDLAPGQETTLKLSVFLDSKTFVIGPRYVGTLHVLAPGETLLAVPVRVQAVPAPAPAQAIPAPAAL